MSTPVISARALPLIRRYVETFEPYELIVAPSGSCVGSIRHQHAMVARRHADQRLAARAQAVAARTYELSQLLVDVLGVDNLGAHYPHRVTYHPTCHSLRLLRVGEAPLRLLSHVSGLELVSLADAEVCCGFGGTFAVKNSDDSTAMLADKMLGLPRDDWRGAVTAAHRHRGQCLAAVRRVAVRGVLRRLPGEDHYSRDARAPACAPCGGTRAAAAAAFAGSGHDGGGVVGAGNAPAPRRGAAGRPGRAPARPGRPHRHSAPPLAAWTRVRDAPAPPAQTFRAWWRTEHARSQPSDPQPGAQSGSQPAARSGSQPGSES